MVNFGSRPKELRPMPNLVFPYSLPHSQFLKSIKITQRWSMENAYLPVLSNQKANAYLKEIADLCGIKKNLTTHLARHTFATTVTLSNGVPIETVGKMLGHKNLRTTQHYAQIINKKVSEDMAVLKGKLVGMTSSKK